MAKSDRLKNMVRFIGQLFKNSRIHRLATALVRKARGEKPPNRPHSDVSDPVFVRDYDPDTLKSADDQRPKDIPLDDIDTDRKIFDAMPDPEIDFSKDFDLEAYTKRLNVPKEKIERWVAAGILRPDEIKVAEKILKIMRKKDSGRKKH